MNNKKELLIALFGYLPYGVKMAFHAGAYVSYRIAELTITDAHWLLARERGAKPILHNINCITKQITINGETFCPIRRLFLEDILFKDISDFAFINLNVVLDNCFSNQFFKLSQKLNEWFIDYRGLISKNLAIDVTTLDVNPYA